MRVLVVEDDRKTASFVAKALRSDGFAVDVLCSGDEALDAIRERSFDAVVLDIMLAGRDGLSVLRQLRVGGNYVPVLPAHQGRRGPGHAGASTAAHGGTRP